MSKLYTVNTVTFKDNQGGARFIVDIVDDIPRDRENIVWAMSAFRAGFVRFTSGVANNYMSYYFSNNEIISMSEENVTGNELRYLMEEYKRNAEIDNCRLVVPKGFDTIEKYLVEVMTEEEKYE